MREKTLVQMLEDAPAESHSIDVYCDATALYSGPVGGNGGNHGGNRPGPILSPWQQQSQALDPYRRPEPSYDFEVSQRSFKIREERHAPLMRIDRIAHHGLPKDHLQFGKDSYTGRHGDEAYEIMGEVMKWAGDKIKMPWEK